jgi:hypothetical protein
VSEQRRHHRATIDVAVEFAAKGSNERVMGHAKDASVGGMFIETAHPLPFASSLVIYFNAPGQKTPVQLPAVVRWTRTGGMGVQFGLLGARETHLITELTKRPSMP